MYCGSCGKQVQEDNSFCPFCGKPIANTFTKSMPSSSQSPQDKPYLNEKSKLLGALVTGWIGGLFIGLGLTLFVLPFVLGYFLSSIFSVATVAIGLVLFVCGLFCTFIGWHHAVTGWNVRPQKS